MAKGVKMPGAGGIVIGAGGLFLLWLLFDNRKALGEGIANRVKQFTGGLSTPTPENTNDTNPNTPADDTDTDTGNITNNYHLPSNRPAKSNQGGSNPYVRYDDATQQEITAPKGTEFRVQSHDFQRLQKEGYKPTVYRTPTQAGNAGSRFVYEATKSFLANHKPTDKFLGVARTNTKTSSTFTKSPSSVSRPATKPSRLTPKFLGGFQFAN